MVYLYVSSSNVEVVSLWTHIVYDNIDSCEVAMSRSQPWRKTSDFRRFQKSFFFER